MDFLKRYIKNLLKMIICMVAVLVVVLGALALTVYSPGALLILFFFGVGLLITLK